VAGLASLRHAEQMRRVVGLIKAERARLFDLLAATPYLRPYPSEANFILCDVVGRDARALKLALEQRGILVRHYARPGLEDCIRVSVGRPEQTDALGEALREW
jgi:histidinol-phosphate aminotransferase